MSNDLVKRLRQYPDVKLPNEAADRIEKLETALRAIIRYAGNTGDDYLADQVREALDAK
jgi:hypothetical protein